MSSHTAVCINDYFSTCQSAISLWSADYKKSSWIDMKFWRTIQVFGGNNLIDNIADNVLLQLLLVYILLML